MDTESIDGICFDINRLIDKAENAQFPHVFMHARIQVNTTIKDRIKTLVANACAQAMVQKPDPHISLVSLPEEILSPHKDSTK